MRDTAPGAESTTAQLSFLPAHMPVQHQQDLTSELQQPSATPEVSLLNTRLQFSRREAALLLGVSVRTVDRLLACKQIVGRRIGRRVLFSRDSLLQFTKRDHLTGGAQ